jgi:hypothetical protein
VFRSEDIARFAVNSVVIAVMSTALTVFIGSLAAYSLSKSYLPYRFRHLLFLWIPITRIFPPITTAIPYLVVLRTLQLGADKGYDSQACVADLRGRKVTPHVAQNTSGRRSAIDGRTTRHVGYAISQRKRKLVEEIFGWMKTVGGFRRTRYIGLERTQLAGYFVAAAYNLVRIAKLVPAVLAR